MFSVVALRGTNEEPGKLELLNQFSSKTALVRWNPNNGDAPTEIDVATIEKVLTLPPRTKTAMVRLSIKSKEKPQTDVFNFIVDKKKALELHLQVVARTRARVG